MSIQDLIIRSKKLLGATYNTSTKDIYHYDTTHYKSLNIYLTLYLPKCIIGLTNT